MNLNPYVEFVGSERVKFDFQICLSPTAIIRFRLERVQIGYKLMATPSLYAEKIKDICVTTNIRVLCKHPATLEKKHYNLQL